MKRFVPLFALRNLFGAVLAAVFMLQAAIPAGYMADRSETGAITAKICGSDGVWLIPIEKDGEPADEHEKQRADQPCVGGVINQAITPPGDGYTLAERLPALALYEENFGPQLVAARARALPPARGPPVAV